jgi:hypothetical protein
MVTFELRAPGGTMTPEPSVAVTLPPAAPIGFAGCPGGEVEPLPFEVEHSPRARPVQLANKQTRETIVRGIERNLPFVPQCAVLHGSAPWVKEHPQRGIASGATPGDLSKIRQGARTERRVTPRVASSANRVPDGSTQA